MRILFLADAHLVHPDDLNYRHFLTFLKGQLGQVDTLVLLGDIFEFWIGTQRTAYAAQLPALQLLEKFQYQGTQIVYVEGNHDFNLAPYFADWPNVTVLPDGGGFTLGDQEVFLAHGDLANPDDRGYRLLRTFLRSAPLRWLAHILPSGLSWRIAERASRQSKRSRNKKSRRWPAQDILSNYARDISQRGYPIIVTGHFHQPFHEKGDDYELVALGDWIHQFSYAVYEDGRFELKSCPPSTAGDSSPSS